MTSWVVGSSPDCDVVVDQPTVSGRHCRVTRSPAGFVVEDLGSTNGTFVNGARISTPTSVIRSDAVTLGALTPLPWSQLGRVDPIKVIRIGREPDNDLVLDHPAVSGHHARLVVAAGKATIEDLGSTNGTSIGAPGRPITRAPLAGHDLVYFGSFGVPASRLLDGAIGPSPAVVPTSIRLGTGNLILGRDPGCDVVVDLPVISGRHARLFRSGGRSWIEDLASSNGTSVNGRRIQGPVAVSEGDRISVGDWAATLSVEGDSPVESEPGSGVFHPGYRRAAVAALVAQGPAIALLTAAIFLPGVAAASDPAGWERVAHGVERLTFTMGLAALWLGASASFLDRSAGRSIAPGDLRGGVEPARRIGLVLAAAVVPGLVFLAIVHAALGLRGPWLPMLGTVAMASAIGLALGSIATASTRSPGAALAVLAGIFAVMVLLAGAPGLPGGSSTPIRLASSLMPSRWAHEGLLLAESDARPTLAPPDADPRDMAERAFPFAGRRMGPTACRMALTSLLIGLGGWAWLASTSAGRDRDEA